ncbi:CopG family transcriptional regulator [Halovibrio salipaludis]|uniref:CopG family transcriptional regulator n=1 Tax=Halovibrio salipaludis TaxID=2032626 RepID=A0A2A2EZV1_9GAMM|nr:CopG family transcriptional regulator [Halovibrio salipaludis]PAU77887.1 CopG family transcriptional regulator [Halovibrio salipaludis]
MGQVTIYLDDETEKKMIANARVMKLSKSKWIAGVIQEKLVDQWPDTVRELAGSWGDFPSLDELRAEASTDTERETL